MSSDLVKLSFMWAMFGQTFQLILIILVWLFHLLLFCINRWLIFAPVFVNPNKTKGKPSRALYRIYLYLTHQLSDGLFIMSVMVSTVFVDSFWNIDIDIVSCTTQTFKMWYKKIQICYTFVVLGGGGGWGWGCLSPRTHG